MPDYLVQEEDGTSKLTLEETGGSLLLEETAADNLNVGFVSSGTSLFALALHPEPVDLALGFIAAGSSLFAPQLGGKIDLGFISSATAIYDPALSPSGAAALALPFIASTSALYEATLAGPVFDWEGVAIGFGHTFFDAQVVWTRLDQ